MSAPKQPNSGTPIHLSEAESGANARIARMISDATELGNSFARQMVSIQSLQSENARLKEHARRLTETLQQRDQERKSLEMSFQNQATQARREMRDLVCKHEQLQAELRKARLQHEEWAFRYQSLEAMRAQDQARIRGETHLQLRAQVDQEMAALKKRQAEELSANQALMQEEIAKCGRKLESATQAYQRLKEQAQAEIARLTAENQKLSTELHQTRKLLAETRDSAQVDLNTLQAQLEKAHADHRRALSELEKRVQAQEQAFHKERAAIQAKCQQAEARELQFAELSSTLQLTQDALRAAHAEKDSQKALYEERMKALDEEITQALVKNTDFEVALRTQQDEMERLRHLNESLMKAWKGQPNRGIPAEIPNDPAADWVESETVPFQPVEKAPDIARAAENLVQAQASLAENRRFADELKRRMRMEPKTDESHVPSPARRSPRDEPQL